MLPVRATIAWHGLMTQVKDLEALLTKDTDYIDLNQFPDHAYYNEVKHHHHHHHHHGHHRHRPN